MNRTLNRLAVCAVLASGLAASTARADLITGSVQFDPNLSTTNLYAKSGGHKDDPAAGIDFKNWTESTFSNLALPTHGTITGDIRSFGLEKGEPAHFGVHGNGTPFSLTFDVHDGSAHGAITFSGLLYGTLEKAGQGRNASTLSIDWTGATTKTIDLDHHVYELSISDLLRKGTFSDGERLGQFDLEIHVMHNPEPASLVLAFLAAPGLGLTWLRRKRKARAG